MTQNYPYVNNPQYPGPNGGGPPPPARGQSPMMYNQQQQQQHHGVPPSSSNTLSPPTTPHHQSRPVSPASDNNPARRAKRHYPTYVADQSSMAGTPPPPQSTMQQGGMPSVQNNSIPNPVYPTTNPSQPNNNDNYASSLTNGVANMNLYGQSQQPTSLREDIPLVGQLPLIHDLDLTPSAPQIGQNVSVTPSPNAQSPSIFKRSTINAVPASNNILKKSKLPFALLLEPYPSNMEVPVVTDTMVARCTRCKTYINPFVRFSQGALKWQCNMCGLDNDVPSSFDWDVTSQQQVDRWSRPELNYGCVDFVASADYMVRPPQPPAYVFIIDTSYQAIQTGMVGAVTNSILKSLDNIPNEDGRTKVALITVDNAVGFYKLSGDEPEMLVVGDLSDIYLPRAPSDLLVDLADAKSMVQDLLERMKTMHNESQLVNNCLGTALQAARKLLSSTGGKIVCFQATLPNVGDGVCKPHEEKKAITETTLMTPSSGFYRTFATECAKSQVCADMFIFGGSFADVATLNVIPRFTGGQTHFYPGFNANNSADALKLEHEIEKLLGEQIGLEAVMRTRCSAGMVCKAFHGNCTTRVPDIMALPNVPRDQSYCVEIGIEEDLQGSHAYFQTALLYTTCFGERRIRVINLCLPIARTLPEVFSAADQTAIARTVCHQAIDKAVTYKLRDARDLLAKETIDISTAYAKEVIGNVATGASRLSLGRNLSLLPFLILGLLKTDTFNEAGNIPADIRARSTVLLRTLPMNLWLELTAPKFYCLHSMPQNAGQIDPNTKQFVMPPRLNLSSEKLERHGLYLLEDGQNIYIWMGKEAVPPLCMDFLNVPNISQVQSGQIAELPKLHNPFSQRATAIVDHIRKERRSTYYPSLYIVKEDGDPLLRAMFLSRLIEDRNANGPVAAGANQQNVNSGMSYFQWLGFVRSKCQ